MKKYLAIGATVVISLGVYEGIKSYLVSAGDYYDDYYWKRSEAYTGINTNAKDCRAKHPEITDHSHPDSYTSEEWTAWNDKVRECIYSSSSIQLNKNIDFYNEKLATVKGKIGELVYDFTY